MANERRRLWLLFGGIAAGSLVHLVVLTSLADQSYFAKYIQFADQLRAGTINPDRLPDLSPGYLWFVTALRVAGFGLDGIRAIQVSMLGAVAVLCAIAALRIAGWPAAAGAALFVLLNKGALVNAAEFEPETLLLLFAAAGLWLLGGRPSSLRLAAAGAAFGLAAIVRPVALLPAAVAGIWIVSRPDIRARALHFAIAASVPLVAATGINYRMTGSFLLMNPGTVFYEGMNPNATGYAGVAPRIVKDIEPTLEGPDTMHVAYRVVASCVAGRAILREEANRYWSRKARAFITRYPAEAVRLTAQKVRNLASRHDAYDVPSMYLKDRELGNLLWLPWPLLFAFAVAGAFARKREGLPVALWTLFAAAVPLVFFVNARHRNLLLAGSAILAGAGVSWLVAEHRARRHSRVVAFAVVAGAATLLLSMPTDAEREDRYQWESTFEVLRLLESRSPAAAAVAETWMPGQVRRADPELRRAAALGALRYAEEPSRQFSVALALIDAGLYQPADRVLASLQEMRYQPFRRSRAVSSISFYRSLAALASGDRDAARRHLRVARREAPADAHVLAMAALMENDGIAAESLRLLYDPFTADIALAAAARSLSSPEVARRYASRASKGCPAWTRPAEFVAELGKS